MVSWNQCRVVIVIFVVYRLYPTPTALHARHPPFQEDFAQQLFLFHKSKRNSIAKWWVCFVVQICVLFFLTEISNSVSGWKVFLSKLAKKKLGCLANVQLLMCVREITLTDRLGGFFLLNATWFENQSLRPSCLIQVAVFLENEWGMCALGFALKLGWTPASYFF